MAQAINFSDNKVAACANILPSIESVFEWGGKVSSADEVGVFFKTTSRQLDVLVARLGEIHPYDTPAIIGWECDVAHPVTMQWLNEVIGETGG